MARAAGRTSLARAAAVALLAVALTASDAAASAGWEQPVRIAGPTTSGITAPAVAISPAGTAAVGFTVEDGQSVRFAVVQGTVAPIVVGSAYRAR